MSASERDCCDPSYEELEQELEQTRAGRETWKKLVLTYYTALLGISVAPEKAAALVDEALKKVPGSE